jgi:hypothetical protein
MEARSDNADHRYSDLHCRWDLHLPIVKAAGRVAAQCDPSVVDEHHFSFLGNSLPAGLNLEISAFRSAESISSAFAGTGREKEFAFFDCYIHEGRRGYTQSVLAIHNLGGSYPACRFDRQLREGRAGEWTLIYHDRRAWPAAEIDAHISSL